MQSPSDSRRIAPCGFLGRAESWAGRSNDDRLVSVATAQGGALIRDIACALVGIRISQRIDISDVDNGPAACDPAGPPQQTVNAKKLLTIVDLRMGAHGA